MFERSQVVGPLVALAVLTLGAARPAGAQSAAADFAAESRRLEDDVTAAQALVLGGKARALVQGRAHVSFDDIRALARPVFRHRLLRNFQAQSEKVTTDHLVDRLLEVAPMPRSGL